MDYSDFLALTRRRQSIRSFSDRAVPADMVERILVAAQEAPTSCNLQLNRYVVVTDPSLREALWREAGAPQTVAHAPVSVVLLFRMGWNHNKLSVAQSLGMAAQNMLLAATTLGLAGIIQAGIGNTDRIRQLLGIPLGYFVASIVSFGWADDTWPRPPRLPVEDVSGRDRFFESQVLAYPRRDVRAGYVDVTNERSPGAEWHPDRWPVAAIGAFRGLAVWHTSPRAGVHRSDRWEPEMSAEIEFLKGHLEATTSTLEVLPYSAAYGARLVADVRLRHLPWEVFELSPHHASFIAKRCQREGVKAPDAYHWSPDLGADLGRRWDRIIAVGTLNHLPAHAELAGFLRRHLAPGGRLLLIMRNAWSFETPLYWRLRRRQVWNFGPFTPRSRSEVLHLLDGQFAVVSSLGLSPTPWHVGRVCVGPLAAVCRTQCLVLEGR